MIYIHLCEKAEWLVGSGAGFWGVLVRIGNWGRRNRWKQDVFSVLDEVIWKEKKEATLT